MIAAYRPADTAMKPAGGVSPRTMADSAARMPTQAMTGSPAIRIGRSTSGCDRRSLIADANMHTYMPMYKMIEMSCSMANAAEVFGATTNTRDRIVTIDALEEQDRHLHVVLVDLLEALRQVAGAADEPHAPARAGDPGDRGGHRAQHQQAGQHVGEAGDPEPVGVHGERLRRARGELEGGVRHGHRDRDRAEHVHHEHQQRRPTRTALK